MDKRRDDFFSPEARCSYTQPQPSVQLSSSSILISLRPVYQQKIDTVIAKMGDGYFLLDETISFEEINRMMCRVVADKLLPLHHLLPQSH
jgi:hypothetical protein